MALPHLLVCAIDFGTTYSGYAFSFTTSRDKIIMHSHWGQCVGVEVAFKTPTCCLVRNEGSQFVAFGYEAQKQFSDLSEDKIQDYSYYDNFKMYLHRMKKIGRTTYISAKRGLNTSAMDLFAMGLRYLSEHMASEVEKQTASRPSYNLVQWVVTVPAIWSDAAKQFMREAAVKAGIIDGDASHNFMIALEPEAASLYCRQLEVEDRGRTICGSSLDLGTNYLVMDCGGGTLDITTHRVSDEGVREVWPPTGADLGAAKVNDLFENLLRDVFTPKVISHYQENYQADWLNFMLQFETKKKAVDPEKKVTTNLSISNAFGQCYKEIRGKKIRDAISEEWKKRGMSLSSGMLRVPHAEMLRLYETVVGNIVDHVKPLIANMKDLSHILLVGGFGESRVLQHTIKKAFDAKLKVVVPEEASLCVMKGATLFGHKPSLIASRRARKTYGTDVYPEFDASKHDPNNTRLYGDTRRIEGLFQVWIRNGDELPRGKVLTFKHAPVSADQSNMLIGLYACEATDPQYVTDAGVQRIGDIIIHMPGHGLDRRIQVKVILGGTEIRVEACDEENQTSTSAVINFLQDETLHEVE